VTINTKKVVHTQGRHYQGHREIKGRKKEKSKSSMMCQEVKVRWGEKPLFWEGSWKEIKNKKRRKDKTLCMLHKILSTGDKEERGANCSG